MNWKNVLLLISADIKSYRLVSGRRFRKFREKKVVTYALYIGACLLGSVIGWLVGNLYTGIADPQMRDLLLQGAVNFFISFPTIGLLYGLVLTQISQVQRMGAQVSRQPLYWFPITWEEHTLASMMANVLGLPLALTLFMAFGIGVAAMFMGLVPIALFTIFALFLSTFTASATTEITKVLQMRISGAITRAAGRAAVWLRLIGSILFFLVFYAVYFSLFYQTDALVLIEIVAGALKVVWFIPYVWLGVALSYFASGYALEMVMFSIASIVFAYALFLVATRLNIRYGLYEMPAIRISRGAYVPKAGFLGRLGIPPLEAAIMRKDFKAFTRRQGLAYIFIFPVIFSVMPLLSMTRVGAEAPTPQALHALHSFLFAFLALLPGTLMATTLGTAMIGLEGESVWYVYSSPIDAKSLVKAKYLFTVLFSLGATVVCSVVGGVIWTPSVRMSILCSVEAVFLTLPLSMVSLSFGIKGADFRQLPRPRMIRPKWMLINGLVCTILAAAIVSPIIPCAVNFFLKTVQASITTPPPIPETYLYIAVPISGAISYAVAYVSYRNTLENAENFLANAEEQYESLVSSS